MLPDLVLFLPFPPSANNLFPSGKTGKRFISPEYQAWKRDAGLTLLSQRRQHFGGNVAVEYEYARFKDKRRRDLANREKAVSDLLVTHGIISDDSMIQEITLRWVDDLAEGVRVKVRPA